jgi:hypothetical protein
MKRVLLLISIVLMVTLYSCEDKPKPGEVKISKDLSFTIDADYTLVYTPKYVLNQETIKVYDINKQLVKTISHVDTLPASNVQVKDTLSYEKNDEVRDTIIYHPKEYQTYIKVSKK